jgi:hypothetical protein
MFATWLHTPRFMPAVTGTRVGKVLRTLETDIDFADFATAMRLPGVVSGPKRTNCTWPAMPLPWKEKLVMTPAGVV